MSKSKYNAKKTLVDGICFDSKAEARRYQELKLLEKAGEIKGLVLQPKYLLQEAFEKNGKRYRAIYYIADFEYLDGSAIIIEDVKGKKTAMYQLKKKMFERRYPDFTITEVEM